MAHLPQFESDRVVIRSGQRQKVGIDGLIRYMGVRVRVIFMSQPIQNRRIHGLRECPFAVQSAYEVLGVGIMYVVDSPFPKVRLGILVALTNAVQRALDGRCDDGSQSSMASRRSVASTY